MKHVVFFMLDLSLVQWSYAGVYNDGIYEEAAGYNNCQNYHTLDAFYKIISDEGYMFPKLQLRNLFINIFLFFSKNAKFI